MGLSDQTAPTAAGFRDRQHANPEAPAAARIRDDDFAGLLDAIDAGIHDPETMPFCQPWTDTEPALRRRKSAQFWWRKRANWRADDWHLELAVIFNDRPIGIQDLSAKDFPF